MYLEVEQVGDKRTARSTFTYVYLVRWENLLIRDGYNMCVIQLRFPLSSWWHPYSNCPHEVRSTTIFDAMISLWMSDWNLCKFRKGNTLSLAPLYPSLSPVDLISRPLARRSSAKLNSKHHVKTVAPRGGWEVHDALHIYLYTSLFARHPTTLWTWSEAAICHRRWWLFCDCGYWTTIFLMNLFVDQFSKCKVYVHHLVSTVRLQRVPLAHAPRLHDLDGRSFMMEFKTDFLLK